MQTAKSEMPEGQRSGFEDQLRDLDPIISAAMEKKAVINLTLNHYSGDIGQQIEHASHVMMGLDEKCRMFFRKLLSGGKEKKTLPSASMMVEACEETMKEGLWYACTAWSVTFRVYQKAGYKGSMSDFVKEARVWPWTRTLKYEPTEDAVGKPLRDGKMLADIEDWEAEGVPKRNRDLAEALLHKLGISI